MTNEKVTAEDIVQYLKKGGFEVYLGKSPYHKHTAAQFAPWEVVADMNGEDLASWYEENQPKRALEALRTENPALYAQVADDKAKHEALQEKGREIYRNNSSGDDRRWYEDSRKCSTLFAEYAAQHPDEEAASMRYQQFEEEAAIAFRPKDYPQDRNWRSEMGNGLISYGLFRNRETGEYLVTMNDNREDFALPLQRYEDRESIVAHKLIDGTGRTPESVLEEAQWLWADHLLPLLRYTPIKNRTHVKAMEEAERLRTIFGSAAARGDGTSAKPLRLVFEFFPAFRRAYAEQGGFYRALNDVFGAADNTKQHGGDKENAKFRIGGEHFAALYTDMNDDDRHDFRKAFNEFEKTLPQLNKLNSDLAYNVSPDLARIAITMRHDAGAQKAANFPDVVVSMKAMEEAERLRTIFGSAAARGDGTSAKPLRLVFEFFPAFRRAYEGKDGFYRALNDVFGEAGNTKQLMDLGVPYCGAPYGGKEEDTKFGVCGSHFADLYADMNDDDRQDFSAAFNEFAKTLPQLNKVNSKLAHNVSQDLSWTAITMRHGAGARKAANFLDVMVKVQEEFRAMTEGRPVKKWIRANKSPAPQW